MAKFKKKTNTSQDIPTASLPDIIFMLLFFFMVTTVLRESSIMVEQNIPRATQLRKLEQKKLVSYLYVGKPNDSRKFGAEPRIQANDAFMELEGIIQFIEEEKSKLAENEQDQFSISLKVDDETKMGIIVDITEKMRDANARKLMYAASRRADNE
ncbi:MAG: biopolymer transporter ExbD [Cyclobacteriaceae bacterium]|nr:biopolymer transporter ExbD [Cyclobacteriaceae bacterium]